MTLSMARLAGFQVGAADAANAILIAATINTLAKAGMAGFVGGARLGQRPSSAAVHERRLRLGEAKFRSIAASILAERQLNACLHTDS
jgi:hypothetical protein